MALKILIHAVKILGLSGRTSNKKLLYFSTKKSKANANANPKTGHPSPVALPLS